MMEMMKKHQVGSLNISQSVIEDLAKLVVREVDGVAALVQAPRTTKEFLLGSKPSPIRISMTGGVACIDLYLLVKPETRIRAVAEEIQHYIKESVQNMTGITVSRVNVYVRGIQSNTI